MLSAFRRHRECKAALYSDPLPKFKAVFDMTLRDSAVTLPRLKSSQYSKAFFPCHLVWIPNKTNFLEKQFSVRWNSVSDRALIHNPTAKIIRTFHMSFGHETMTFAGFESL